MRAKANGTDSLSLRGSISLRDNGAGTFYVTYNADVSTGGRILRYKALTFVLNESISPQTVLVSGHVYHPDYGYVTLSTRQALQVYTTQSHPTAGVLYFSGAHSTNALVTFNGDAYTLDVDDDGDGAVDATLDCGWTIDTCTAR